MSTSFPGIQRLRCPNCPASFRDDNGLYQHIKAKHGGRGNPKRQHAHEQSLAEIAIEASIKRAMGEPLDPLEESLLP